MLEGNPYFKCTWAVSCWGGGRWSVLGVGDHHLISPVARQGSVSINESYPLLGSWTPGLECQEAEKGCELQHRNLKMYFISKLCFGFSPIQHLLSDSLRFTQSISKHTYNIPVINTILKNMPFYTNVTYKSDATTLQFWRLELSLQREVHTHQPLQWSVHALAGEKPGRPEEGG